MTVRWNNGSPLLENIPPGSYYAQIPDNLGAENKVDNLAASGYFLDTLGPTAINASRFSERLGANGGLVSST